MIIGFPHTPQGQGGPGSFQERFERCLKKRGHRIVYPHDRVVPDIVFVIGGTRRLVWLLRCKIKGSKVIHRLDGFKWHHRVLHLKISECILWSVQNLLMRVIRDHIADSVIYQSRFAQDIWHSHYGVAPVKECIIINGVSLTDFVPQSSHSKKKIICVEGAIPDIAAYVEQLQAAASIVSILHEKGMHVEVYGEVLFDIERYDLTDVVFKGLFSRDKISDVYRDAIFFAIEINGACPNSVIEALASGIPVIGFDSGSLRELVPDDAGIIIPYGADPWKLEVPAVEDLCAAVKRVLSTWDEYSRNARHIAEERYDIEKVTERYIRVVKGLT